MCHAGNEPEAAGAIAVTAIANIVVVQAGAIDISFASARVVTQRRDCGLHDLIHDKALSTLVTMEELLVLGGSSANEYFRAWSAIQLRWKALKQRPIPEDWRTYKSRSALREELRVNRGATHPVNAMLNCRAPFPRSVKRRPR